MEKSEFEKHIRTVVSSILEDERKVHEERIYFSVERKLLKLGVAAFALGGLATCAGATYVASQQAEDVAEVKVAELEAREVASLLSRNEDFLGSVNSTLDDAVLAFDGDCPSGWIDVGSHNSDYSARFAGRVLVTAGPPTTRENGQSTSFRGIGGQQNGEGGKENLSLKIEHLPAHQHKIAIDFKNATRGQGVDLDIGRVPEDTEGRLGYNKGGSYQTTSTVGAGKDIDNMPPFVAIRFCKKLGDNVGSSN